MIEISTEQLNKMIRLLDGVKDGPEKALYNAVNRGLSRVRRLSAQYASGVYEISQGAIKSHSKIKQVKASPGANTIGSISFGGTKLALMQFKVSGGHGSTVKVAVKKGGGGTLYKAFIANMGHGSNVIERVSSKRTPTETLMGLSAAQMIGNEEVALQIEMEAEKVVSERIDHEIERLLNNW